MGLIEVAQNPDMFFWAGIPWRERFSDTMKADCDLVAAIRNIDDLLDMKFYLKTQKWHLIRYYLGRDNGEFVTVWELDDKPELGLRKDPGVWMIEALKMADTHGDAELLEKVLDEADAKVQESMDRELADQCNDYAREIRKPLIDLYNYGPNKSYKGFF